MKVLAIDVGLVNCSCCVAEACCECLPVLGQLHELVDAGTLGIECLESVKLGTNKNATAASIFDNVIAFLQARTASFAEVDAIVIETQMSARMKAIAAAFYTAARCLFPRAAVLFQSATAKLNFADLVAYCEGAASATYAQRKKTSVAIAKKLLAANVRPEIKQTFSAAKKKDDLSDALLHALAALCAHGKGRKAQRRAQPSKVGAST
jgi:hypothetical protein